MSEPTLEHYTVVALTVGNFTIRYEHLDAEDDSKEKEPLCL